MPKTKILVSACLLGAPCRYDALSKPNEDVKALSREYELIPVCPEQAGGLPTPRIPSEINGAKVINREGVDVTRNYKKGAEYALKLALENDCKIAILKSKSPSCGKGLIYDGSFSKTLKKGDGVCARLLINNEITVFTEDEIDKIGN